MIFKKALMLFIFLLLIKYSFAQNFTIKGKVPTEIQGNIQSRIDKKFLNRSYDLKGTMIIDGKFELNNTLERNYFVEISNSQFKATVYGEPGEVLEFDIKSPGDDLLNSIKGKGAEQNLFYRDFQNRFKDDFNDSLNEAMMKSSTIDKFESVLFAKRKAMKDFVQGDARRNVFSADFTTFIDNEITYYYWKNIFAFPIVIANSDKKLMTVSELPSIMLTDFSQVKINNEPALISKSYRDFIRYYIIYSSSQANGFKKFTDLNASTDRKSTVAREKLDDSIYLFWLAKYTIDEYQVIPPSSVRKMLGLLKDADKNKIYWDTVNDLTKNRANEPDPTDPQAKPVIMDGKDAALTDLDGKPVDLTKLKGKVVYIDFWASWCGPCRKMFPFSKAMHDGLSEKQKKAIAFLYISIDADTGAWKKAIKDLSIEGIHFISPGNWNSKVCKYFNIYSIPRYMIMNKKGEIVDMNAKRPADSAVLTKLLELAAE